MIPGHFANEVVRPSASSAQPIFVHRGADSLSRGCMGCLVFQACMPGTGWMRDGGNPLHINIVNLLGALTDETQIAQNRCSHVVPGSKRLTPSMGEAGDIQSLPRRLRQLWVAFLTSSDT